MLNLLEDLQEEFGLTYIFIAHDLGVVRHVSDRIAVIYLGKLVELSPAAELYERPIIPTPRRCSRPSRSRTPTSRRAPRADRARRRRAERDDPPTRCRFHTRCPYVQPTRCRDEEPHLRPLAPGHTVACHWAEDIKSGKIRPKVVAPTTPAQEPVANAG